MDASGNASSHQVCDLEINPDTPELALAVLTVLIAIELHRTHVHGGGAMRNICTFFVVFHLLATGRRLVLAFALRLGA